MPRGRFIVLEGVDGAGTTTQVERLVAALAREGRDVVRTREPTDGPVGKPIREVLAKRLTVPGPDGPRAPGWATMTLWFAADRLHHNEATIAPGLSSGAVVVSDRYVHSSIAYQSVSSGDDGALAWVQTLNREAVRPDLTIVLDVSPEVAAERRGGRGEDAELYETSDLQVRLAAFYRTIEAHFPGDRIVHVDGEADADRVAAAVLMAARAVL